MITIDPPSSSLALEALRSISKSGLARFLRRACTAAGVEGEVSVLLTTDAEIRRLNKAFRGRDEATDVLSFPAAEEAVGVAGDLAVSLDRAAVQAAEQGHDLRDEVRILMLHGVLHLAGEDHETDAGEMAAREESLRRVLSLPAGLIERAGAAS